METSFKNWYNKQSDLVKSYLYDKLNGSAYFAFENEDFYRFSFDNPDNLVLKEQTKLRYDNDAKNLIAYLLRTVDTLNHSPEVKKKLLELKDEAFNHAYSYYKYDTVDSYKTYVRKNINSWNKTIETILFYTYDYDNIDWTDLVTPNYHPALIELFGKEKCLEKYKSNIRDMTNFICSAEFATTSDPIFDELFFGSDGWSEEAKAKFVSSFTLDTQIMDSLCYHIFSVDISYMRYLKDACARDWSAVNKLCQQRKDEFSYNVNRVKESMYRYNKIIRQILYAIYACDNKKLNKLTVAKLGDLAGMVKLYNFDLDAVLESCFDMFNESTSKLTA